ncbi:hypothetical protein VTH06DRAFT_7720 [Thermothelomyces fergusii]
MKRNDVIAVIIIILFILLTLIAFGIYRLVKLARENGIVWMSWPPCTRTGSGGWAAGVVVVSFALHCISRRDDEIGYTAFLMIYGARALPEGDEVVGKRRCKTRLLKHGWAIGHVCTFV